MKENLENLKSMIIKDALSTSGPGRRKDVHIFTHEDLEQHIENLIFNQFKEDKNSKDQDIKMIKSLSSLKDGEQTNISKIDEVLEIAMTEIICSKAINMQQKSTPEAQL